MSNVIHAFDKVRAALAAYEPPAVIMTKSSWSDLFFNHSHDAAEELMSENLDHEDWDKFVEALHEDAVDFCLCFSDLSESEHHELVDWLVDDFLKRL